MNTLIETLNHWGENFLGFAWPMLWQSSLLIVIVFALDMLLARKIRASIRHALWLVVLVKLLLPPALALPTGATWWLWPAKPQLVPEIKTETVTFDASALPENFPLQTVPISVLPPKLNGAAWTIIISGVVGAGLLFSLLFQWLKVERKTHNATATGGFAEALEQSRQLAGLRGPIRLRLVDDMISPAVYGLFRPVILLPRALAEKLSPAQLRAVLLHEAIHLRRGDVWVNCAQTLLQIFYWWHPLLWLANARIRRLREEAVDDAVMMALRGDADAYAPTLLEVAKFAFRRPLASLGLVGILESRSALRQRVERLVDFRPPRKAGVTFLSLCGIFLFGAVALPMGQAPAAATDSVSANPQSPPTAAPSSLDDETNVTNSDVIVNTTAGRKNILRKLKQIHLDSVSFQYLTLNEALQMLHRQSLSSDPDKEGINFLFNTNNENIPATQISITLKLKNVSLMDTLDAICRVAYHPIKYSVTDDAVIFEAETNNLPKYEMRTFEVVTNVFVTNLRRWASLQPIDGYGARELPAINDSGNVYVGTKNTARDVSFQMKRRLSHLGVNLDPPKTIFFNDRLGMLFVYATPHDMDIIENAVLALNDPRWAFWNVTTSSDVSDRKQAADAWEKVGQEFYEFRNFDEAKRDLDKALALDPDNKAAKHYLNLILQAKATSQSGSSSPAARVAAVSANAGLRFDVEHYQVMGNTLLSPQTIDMVLTNVDGAYGTNVSFEAVRAVVTELQRAYQDRGYMNVTVKLPQQKLTNATVKIQVNEARPGASHYTEAVFDPDALFDPFGVHPMAQQVSASVNTADLITNYFRINMAAFDDAVSQKTGESDALSGFKEIAAANGVDFSPPEYVAIMSERLGMFYVVATRKDMGTILGILDGLNCMPPQIHIKARFIEVSKTFFDDAQNTLPAGATNGGILTSKQFHELLHQLQSQKGSQELAEPECTTITGRQTEMRATESQQVLLAYGFKPNPSANWDVPAVVAQTTNLNFGPICDVVPLVMADGYTINLKAIGWRTEFFGYADPKGIKGITTNWNGSEIKLPVSLPAVQLSSASSQALLYDGQTLVMFPKQQPLMLQSPSDEKSQQRIAKYIQQAEKNGNKTLVVFITATLIDPVGNRMHSDKDMSFAQNSVPQQPVNWSDSSPSGLP